MASMRVTKAARAAGGAGARSLQVFLQDVGHGMLQVTHNAFAVLGMVLASLVLFAAGRADIRHEAEAQALGWLQARQVARVEPVMAPTAPSVPPSSVPALAVPALVPATVAAPAASVVQVAVGSEDAEPAARSTSFEWKDLSRPQAAVANWLARRYKVAPEPVGALVKEAWQAGNKAGLDPTLILAIMAVESSFNPFAQSAVGAQGLMQVMTKVHNAKYEAFGGNHAAFDPVSNLRVGVQVLKECIAHAGSLEAGLRFYVGSGNQSEDGGYAGKVLSEQNSLRLVVGGKAPPPRPPVVTVSVPATHSDTAAAPAGDAKPSEEPAARNNRPEEIALLRDATASR